MNFWSDCELSEKAWQAWRIGRLTFRIRLRGADIQLGYEHSEALRMPEYLGTLESADESNLIRLVAENPIRTVRLLPSLPDRPIVVATRMPIRLLPKQSALFYLGIPVWIRIVPPRDPDLILTELPTEVLSNTWFGDNTSGVLCYTVDSYLLRRINKSIMLPHYAMCPVKVRNASRGTLDFRKVSIYTPYLNCYRSGEELWTNQVQVTFVSGNKVNISVSTEAPQDQVAGGSLQLLTHQRRQPERNIFRKSFTILREATGLR